MDTINIKEVLKNKGFSQAKVADYLGMGRQNFGQQLDRNPSFEFIKRISDVTGISLDELAGFNKKQRKPILNCPHCGNPIVIELKE